MHRITMTIIALAAVGTASAADAQARTVRRAPRAAPSASRSQATPDATGLMLGVYTLASPGLTIEGEDIEGDPFQTELGGGAGVQIGYGFSRRLMAFAAIDLAKQGSGIDGVDGNFGLVHFEIGARLNLPIAGSRALPYALASFSGRAVGAEVRDDFGDRTDVSLSGTALGVGGGVQFFLSPGLALDTGARLGYGKFGRIKVDGDEEDIDVDRSTTTRLHVGLNWYP
jgi:hypothetical protein